MHLPDVYPPFLWREVHANHGVISCEGSMFKSKFANALTTMMIGSLGLASAENKLSVAYGGDAGHMDDLIQWMCARYTNESLVITRSLESQQLLSGLGVPNELGADTAWTFEPYPQEYARQTLRAAGWDEKTPILVLCPIHPFVWPVRASIAKYLARATTGALQRQPISHRVFLRIRARRSIASSSTTPRATSKPRRLLCSGIACFRYLVAMERLDAVACRGHRKRNSWHADLHFRRLRHVPTGVDPARVHLHGFLALSRHRHLHARGVVSAGVTMDERIRNLMRERGHQHLLLTVEILISSRNCCR